MTPWTRRLRRAAAGLLLAAAAATQAAPPVLTLAVAGLPFAGPVLIAEAQGYFAAEGLALNVVRCAFGRVCLQQLLDGQAHFATVADTPIAFASFTRKDFAVVATFATSAREHRLLVRADRGIAAAADLKGKRLGIFKGTSAHYFADTFLRFHGIDPAEVRVVALDAGDPIGALVRGEIDAAALFNPHGGNALRQLGAKARVLAAPAFFNATYNLVSVAAAAGAGDDDVVRLLRALRRGEELIKSQPGRARAIVAAALQSDPAAFDAVWPDYDFRLQLAPTLISTLEAQSRWALREKLVPQGSRLPDSLDFVRAGPLRRVNPRAVRLID